MPYGWKVNEVDGSVSVAPIEYYCIDCNFSTLSQDEEKKHYGYDHFTKSRILYTIPYDVRIHGTMPSWVRTKMLKVTTI